MVEWPKLLIGGQPIREGRVNGYENGDIEILHKQSSTRFSLLATCPTCLAISSPSAIHELTFEL